MWVHSQKPLVHVHTFTHFNLTCKTSENGDIEEISGMEKLGDSAYGEAVLATSSCKPFARRLEMYRIAADAGHVEGRVR